MSETRRDEMRRRGYQEFGLVPKLVLLCLQINRQQIKSWPRLRSPHLHLAQAPGLSQLAVFDAPEPL